MALRSLLSRLKRGGLTLIGGVIFLILVWGTLAPVGTLAWWLELETERLKFRKDLPPEGLLENPNFDLDQAKLVPKNCYIVFLPGIGDVDGDLTPGETEVLQRLVSAYPACVPVDGVFPYSAANEALEGRRLLRPLWEFAQEAEGWFGLAEFLIDIRNLWRMAISADNRYGPVYNRGIAIAIIQRMQAEHPIGDRPLNLILIGTSGGAQIALAATPYLDQWLQAEIVVISIGGFFQGTDGFAQAEQVYHLQGRRDWIDDIAAVLFPSRWPWTLNSPFNQAKRQGRFTGVTTGPHTHQGAESYFDPTAIAGRQQTYVDLTVQTLKQLPLWSNLSIQTEGSQN